MTDISEYIESHLEDSLEQLAQFIALPSVSAQETAIFETADFVKELMEVAGLEAAIVPKPEPGNPVVIGQLTGESPYTLLFYNHYDVQPPEPLDLWTSPPFEMRRDGERLFGRGASDNKGHLISRLLAVSAVRESWSGRLPISIKFLVEGDEEIGSPRLGEFMIENRGRLAADVSLQEGGGVNSNARPIVSLGVKGILSVNLRVRTAVRDVHSSTAAVNPNAAWRLVWALSTLKDREERVLIPGFYDQVREPTEIEEGFLREIPSHEERTLRGLKMRDFVLGVRGYEYQKRLAFAPTCTINGIGSGYQGRGTKTVNPAIAFAKLDFRLVPDQHPDDIVSKLRDHLDSLGFDDVRIEAANGELPARSDPAHPFVEVVRSTAQEVHGVDPIVIPNGAGTQPLHAIMHTLNLPMASAGISNPDSRAHAPDENVRVRDFVNGTRHVAAIIEALGGLEGRTSA